MNNSEIRYLTKEEQLEYSIKYLRKYLLRLKEELNKLETELEEERKNNDNKERNIPENTTCKLYRR